MKLDLGSGFAPYRPDDPEWVHLDANPNAPHVECVCDAFGCLPFEDDQLDELRAVDIAEHASYRRVDAVFSEWARILKPGGTLFVQVPSARTIMAWCVRNDERLMVWEKGQPCTPMHGAMWRLYGGLDDGRFVEEGGDPRYNVHMSMFDQNSLRDVLMGAGFMVGSITENQHPNLIALAKKRAA